MTTTITTTVNASAINSMGYDYWWCPCGISPSDVDIVYQPKGAASYAASLINLANPGTNDAFDDGGDTVPSWNTSDGWIADGDYLRCNYTPQSYAQSGSMLVRFSNAVSGTNICGQQRYQYGYTEELFVLIHIGGMSQDQIVYYNGDSTGLSISASCESGVFGIAGNKGYRNGVQEEGIIATGDYLDAPISPLGYISEDDGVIVYYGTVARVQAEVWYNVILTPEQMATVSLAMAAL